MCLCCYSGFLLFTIFVVQDFFIVQLICYCSGFLLFIFVVQDFYYNDPSGTANARIWRGYPYPNSMYGPTCVCAHAGVRGPDVRMYVPMYVYV